MLRLCKMAWELEQIRGHLDEVMNISELFGRGFARWTLGLGSSLSSNFYFEKLAIYCYFVANLFPRLICLWFCNFTIK